MSALARQSEQLEQLTYTVEQACAVSNLGRTRIYELLSEQKLESITIGRRRLIKAQSLKRLLETGC